MCNCAVTQKQAERSIFIVVITIIIIVIVRRRSENSFDFHSRPAYSDGSKWIIRFNLFGWVAGWMGDSWMDALDGGMDG